jgi:hypothetical protein
MSISIFRISAVVVITLALSLDAFAQMGSGRGVMRTGGFGRVAGQRVAGQQWSREPAMVSPTAPVQTYGTQVEPVRRLVRHPVAKKSCRWYVRVP